MRTEQQRGSIDTLAQRMLEVNEAAEALGISVATIKRYRKRGLIGGDQYTEGGKWVFPESEIRQFKARAFRKGLDAGDG